jgi:hypothetical protein
MLAQTLQWLEGDGLVARQVHEVVPPHVDYSLTPLGRGAAERVRLLADWIEVNLPEVLAQQSRREAGAGPSDAPAGVDAAPVAGEELVAGADQPAPRPARWSDMLPAASSASAGQT